MIFELDDFTWQTLYEYIERRIAGVLDTLQLIRMDSQASSFAHMSESQQHQLNLLRSCLPLVREMQSKEDLQMICPIMSVDLIHLRCRSQPNHQVSSSDFAWITPIAEERYSLMRIETKESEAGEILWSF